MILLPLSEPVTAFLVNSAGADPPSIFVNSTLQLSISVSVTSIGKEKVPVALAAVFNCNVIEGSVTEDELILYSRLLETKIGIVESVISSEVATR